MTFGEKLYQLRMEKRISQEVLARELGVSRQAISRWELGEVVPDTTNVLAVSRLFGVSTDYLLREECLSEQDIPAVKTAELDLRQRQQAVGKGMLHRCAALAAPALYHTNVRNGDEPEMLPFLIVWALLFGILLARSNVKVEADTGKDRRELLLPDTLSVCCVCFLPPLFDWIPAGYGVLVSQLISVFFLKRSWEILRKLYHLPAPPPKKKK